MTSAQPFTHSTTPILQGWLIKGLRLVHSEKPGDRDKLLKLYEEACENEAQVCRITINDALKDPRDNLGGTDLGERESGVPLHSGSSRIRPVHLIGDPQLISTNPASSTNSTESSSTPSQVASTLTGRLNSRGKVAFFDIFGSSSSLSVATSQSTTVVSTSLTSMEATVGATSSITAAGTFTKVIAGDSSSENMGPNGRSKTGSLDSVCLPCTVPLRADIPPNTIIDLTCTEPSDSLSVLSAAASALDTKCTSTTSVNSESIPTGNKSDDIPSTADPKILASLVADLACSVCGKLTTQPQMEPDGKTMNANVLIECIQCGALYHQLCHQPPILSAKPVVQREWRCGNCCPSSTETNSASGSKSVKTVEALSQASSDVPPTNKKPRQTGVELLINVPSVGARKRKPGFVHPQLDAPRKHS